MPLSKPNYLPAVLRKARSVASKPGLHVLNVRHDDWCAVFRGGTCNCNPEVDDPQPLPDPQALEEMRREIAELSTPESQAKEVPF